MGAAGFPEKDANTGGDTGLDEQVIFRMVQEKTGRQTFLDSCDANGRAVFSRLFEYAEDLEFTIAWKDAGFALDIETRPSPVNVCLGFSTDSANGQSIVTTLSANGNTWQKAKMTPTTVKGLREQAQSTGLFVPAGPELKCEIARQFSDSEVDALLAWCSEVAKAILGMVRPLEVKPLDGYRIWLRYSDGAAGEIDLSHLAGQGVFKAWDDRAFFEKVYIHPEGAFIAWSDELDLCPDAAYMQLTGKPLEEMWPHYRPSSADA